MRHERWEIGGRVDLPAATPLFDAGRPGWFCLICAPQREAVLEQWLAARGIYAFHPVIPRMTRTRGGLRRVERRYLPGYVFARFPGRPRGHVVLASPMVRDVLRMRDGTWGELSGADLRRLHRMRSVDAAADAARARAVERARQRAAWRVGQSALFRAGPLAELPCEVVALPAEGRATVRLTLFARPYEQDVAVDDLLGPDGEC